MVKTYVFTSPDWDVTLATNSSISEQIRIKNYLRDFLSLLDQRCVKFAVSECFSCIVTDESFTTPPAELTAIRPTERRKMSMTVR